MLNHKLVFIICVFIAVYLIFLYQHKIQLMFNSSNISLYTPNSMKVDDYTESIITRKIIEGKKIAKQRKIIITALLRDTEEEIPHIIKKTEAVGNLFEDYRILIVENNSKDLTRFKLLEWAKINPKVIILGCGVNYIPPEGEMCDIKFASKKTEGHGVDRVRINKMVELRNLLLESIKSSGVLRNFDYTIMWDLDIVGTVYLDGILASVYEFENYKNSGVSAICSQGIRKYGGGLLSIYYDTYAHIDHGDNFHLDNKFFHDINKGYKHGQHRRGSDLVNVKSCFSGFTIYRTKDLLPENVKYTMTEQSDNKGKKSTNIECEHVRLAKTLRGRVTLNPNMVNLVLLNK